MFKIRFKFQILLISLFCLKFAKALQANKRLLCYYDATTTAARNATLTEQQLMKALTHCTHLMYGNAQILPHTWNIGNLIVKPEPAILKLKFPHLKIFLTLGGDTAEYPQLYLQVLEADKEKQNRFIKNVRNFLIIHHFDGIDLAFPFPRNKPQKVHSSIGMFYKKFKKLFTGDEIMDQRVTAHKHQYSDLASEMKKEFSQHKLQMSMTVLPNVNSTWYFDILEIHKNFQFINLFAFDFVTPIRNPEEADYAAPIQYKEDAKRKPYANIEYQVNHWIGQGCPRNKLVLGIASYGQAWKMTIDSGLSGVPIISNTNGPAVLQGVLSWSELCTKLKSKGLVLHKVRDSERKYGTYAFSPANGKGGSGIWLSFDDPEFAGIKAEYVNKHNMGGVALYDLKHDDFKSKCNTGAFPILQRISKVLGITEQIKNYGKQQF